jgi:hypothetical protein
VSALQVPEHQRVIAGRARAPARRAPSSRRAG